MRNPVQAMCSSFAILLAGCTSIPQTTAERIDNRQVEYAMTMHDTVPVVFENGLGGIYSRAWEKVLPELAKDTTTFAYNRPGYGASEAVATPRDGEHIVEGLRSVLLSKGLEPPYVLVGHSLGGLYMQYFARRYPDEVAALILVDSTHPNQAQGDGAIRNWPVWNRVLLWLSPRVIQNELAGAGVTGEATTGLPPFIGKPVILLSALHAEGEPADANEKRKDLLRLYPGAKQVWVESGHLIPREKPEVVIEAIREVLSDVRHGNAARSN